MGKAQPKFPLGLRSQDQSFIHPFDKLLGYSTSLSNCCQSLRNLIGHNSICTKATILMARINRERLHASLSTVNQFGFDAETGGIHRMGYSTADFDARNWLMEEMKSIDLIVSMDGVGNVTGRFGPESGPCIMSGSHLDSVPNGGKFDGVLGVVAALECVRAIIDSGLQPKYAIEVVAFAEEEGRFGGMLGSQALSGTVDAQWLETSRDASGITLKDAMSERGLNYRSALTACQRKGGDCDGCIKAFIELHIEQGPDLEAKRRKVGVVTGISGTINPLYTLKGEANHSGTTPMDMRKDAVMCFCEMGVAIPDIIREFGSPDARMTIGKVDVSPNFPHTVAGDLTFSLNIRDCDHAAMISMNQAFAEKAAQVAENHRVELSVDNRLGSLKPVALDPALREIVTEEVAGFFNDSSQWQIMPSGAGHDAQNMQQICPAAMLFIPSRKGISHAPEEHTDAKDIDIGVQVLCNVLCRLMMT